MKTITQSTDEYTEFEAMYSRDGVYTAKFIYDLGFHCATLYHNSQLPMYTVVAHYDGLAADIVLYSGNRARQAEAVLNELICPQGFDYYPLQYDYF